MFDGYLEVGGVEVVNNERTRGYARTIACPFNFKDVPCDTLEEALAALAAESGEPSPGPYTYDSIVESPWYDRTAPSESSRFLGVFATSMKGFYSSTRSATVTETIGDGGNVGLQRRATREVRVRATLLARGRDALEYGTRWLDAALDPAACGRHAESCGTTDMLYLTDCPPARSEVTSPSAQWGDPVTNIATNPSFEATGAAVTIRQNLINNPRLATANTSWVASSGATREAVVIPAYPDVAFSWGSVGAPQAPALNRTVGVAVNLIAGVVYTATALVLAEGPSWSLAVIDGTVVTGSPVVVTSRAIAGSPNWREESITFTAASASASITLRATAAMASSLYGITRAIVAPGSNPVPFFDGATPAAGDFTYSWAGAANASASNQTGLLPAGGAGTNAQIVSSTAWALDRTRSARIIANHSTSNQSRAVILPAFPVVPGDVYTVMATLRLAAPLTGTLWANALKLSASIPGSSSTLPYSPAVPNTAGEHPVRWVITVPSGATTMDIRANAGAPNGGGDLWVDNLVVVKGDYSGPYFDGSSLDVLPTEDTPEGTVLADYTWAGAVDGSTSTWTPGIVVAIEDPVLYLDTLESHLRYLHGVGTVSGPNEGTETDLGNDFWMLEVEFVLVAGRPFVYSITKPVVLPVTPDTVVDDVPKNLIPYPSAVLPAAAPVVVARNFSTNPSVETNATGWTGTATVISGTAPGAAFTSGRVNELAANRAWSFKGQIIGPAASSGKTRITLTQTVTPTLTPTTRVSVNIWGAVLRLAGTDPGTTLDKLSASAQWQDAASAAVGPVIDLGTATVDQYGGHPFNKSGLLPPAGATKIKVQIDAEVTWTTGSDVRVYADALAVSVP